MIIDKTQYKSSSELNAYINDLLTSKETDVKETIYMDTKTVEEILVTELESKNKS